MENKIRFDLLEQLADHLDRGQLGHEVFDFSTWNSCHRVHSDYAPNGCGTNGCSIGECPILWPDKWTFHEWNRRPILIGSGLLPITSAAEFFGLSIEDCNYLFTPMGTITTHPITCGTQLPRTATRYEAAAHIRDYITKMQA